MRTQKLGIVIAGVGAVYLVMVAWLASWWYVPAYRDLGPRVISEPSHGGTAVFVLWAVSGILGAVLVAVGAAIYSAIGRFRLLLFSASSTFCTGSN